MRTKVMDVHQRIALLQLQIQLQEEEEEDDNFMLALVVERQRVLREGRRARRWWVRPWIERRRLFGQYDTLFQELDRESGGDYMGYIRMDRNLFSELLLRVTPRITKGPWYVFSM